MPDPDADSVKPQCSSRQHIRRQIRQRRRALSDQQQRQAAHAAAGYVLALPHVQSARDIALYITFDGELDTRPLIEALWREGKRLYLPRLHPFCPGHLLFLRYLPHTVLQRNHLHTCQPSLDVRQLLPLAQLDVLITPLVAFDQQGQRLGMGGGFYDRTLQHWRQQGFLPVGYAHDCQQVARLPAEIWDIPLPVIVTPSGVHRFF